MVPDWLPGPKKDPFWVTLGYVLDLFWFLLCVTFHAKCNAFVQDVVTSVRTFYYRL